jgi:hypothetical protein
MRHPIGVPQDGKQKLNQKSDNVLLPMLENLVLPKQKLNQKSYNNHINGNKTANH